MPRTMTQTIPLRARRSLLARVADAFAAAALRRRHRQQLALLDAHLLRDIGLDAHEAQTESAKPFWRP
ncbi:MAG: DUF1127 domain-containing protein [Tabrizicola sp.]